MLARLKVLLATAKQYLLLALAGCSSLLALVIWFQARQLRSLQVQLLQSHYDNQAELYKQQQAAAEKDMNASEERLKAALAKVGGDSNAR